MLLLVIPTGLRHPGGPAFLRRRGIRASSSTVCRSPATVCRNARQRLRLLVTSRQNEGGGAETDGETKTKKSLRNRFRPAFDSPGVIFTLDSMGRLEAGRIWSYWPLLLLAMGLPSLIAPKDSGDPVWGVALTALGGFFLARKFDVIEWSYRDVWPAFLLLAGLTLIVQSFRQRRGSRPEGVQSLENGGAR